MTTYTPEQAERYTRLMAEAIFPSYNAEAFDEGFILNPKEGKGSQYMGISFPHDLNALAQVARVICQTERGRKLLKAALREAWLPFANKVSKAIWRECLTAEQLFPIIGKALEKLKENENA